MRRIRVRAAAIALLSMLVLTASAQAVTTNFTTSNVTAPADGTLEYQNLDTNPNATFTVSGTTNWVSTDTSNLFDVRCYNGNSYSYSYEGGSGNPGIALNSGSNFSIQVPQSDFASASCHLVVVPHGTPQGTPPATDNGPRVGFSEFQTYPGPRGTGPTYDYYFQDATLQTGNGSNSIDGCGPYPQLVDGMSTMTLGSYLFNCAGSFYTSASDRIGSSGDLKRSEIEIDGQNAYGSYAADSLFTGSSALPGFPVLTASLDSFDTSNGNAQTTESESLVRCTPNDVYSLTSTDCTAFASTGVAIKRITDYTNSGRVVTVTDELTSTDGQAHAVDLQYETDLGDSAAGWQLPGQSGYSYTNGYSGPAASTAPQSLYAIDNTGASPSLTNPVGTATFSAPYHSVTLDDTIWGPGYPSALFDYQQMVPAGGSVLITWSYATGSSLAEVQGYAAAAPAAMAATEDAAQAPAIAISSPTAGTTETSSPVSVTGTASAGSGVKSVTVNGVGATVSGGSWSASVPLTALGQNTLTATLTSNSGKTTTATATVAYVPPASVSLRGKRFNGRAVLVKLACSASGSPCGGRVTVYATKTVTRHHKKHRVSVLIASKRYAIGVGQTATVSAGLNSTGRRLLKTLGKLKAKGTVTVTESGGKSHTAAHFSLTLKQPKKKHHK